MSSDEDLDIKKIIRIETLLNAQLHNGAPQAKPIMGKILGKYHQFRPKAKEINRLIEEEVEKVKSLSLDEIKTQLEQLDPEAVDRYYEKKESQVEQRLEQKRDLPELPNAVKGKVKVRYAPDPSKYPHLGQGINYLINRIYADKYDGEVILRFDDTNPAIVKPVYYKAIREGLEWIGAYWDEEIRASQFIEEFYDITKELIKKKLFYVCFCNGNTLSEKRKQQMTCEHRKHAPENNLENFEKMIEGHFKVGDAVVRLVGDMKSENPVMRDPIMMRLVEEQHPMLDQFYYVFPTYDFESSYLEYKMQISHVIRSGEFGSMREELQSFIIQNLGGKVPEFVQFGRVNIQGCPTKGRVIRELVQNGVVNGWDDIRLITLIGLQNRGIHPKTPKIIVQETGLSPQNTQIAWSTIEAKSRQLLEPDAKRFFFVQDPVKLKVGNVEEGEVSYPYHPDHPEYGRRTISYGDTFFISKDDALELEVGDIFRLKDLFNVEILSTGDKIEGTYKGEELLPNTDKIQWVSHEYIEGTLRVPLTLENEKGEIRENSMETISGYFEPDLFTVEEDEVVQLERVGFAKVFVEGEKVKGHIVHLY